MVVGRLVIQEGRWNRDKGAPAALVALTQIRDCHVEVKGALGRARIADIREGGAKGDLCALGDCSRVLSQM